MLVRQLITRLGFNVDLTGAKQYDAALQRIQQRVNGVAQSLGSLPRTITVRVNRVGGGGSPSGPGAGSGPPGRAAPRSDKADGFFGQFIGGMRGFASSIAIWNEIVDSVAQFIGKIATAALLIPRAGDAMAASLATINSVLEDTAKSAEVYEKLYQQVRLTGASIDETAKAFTKYQIALQENGKSTDDTIDLVTGLQAAMSQMGMSVSEVNSVTTQLGQALGSGVLSGEEWKTIRENMPALARTLRDATGQTAETMKKFVDDQKLTTDIVIEPLLAFARTWREKLANAPLRMGTEWANLGTTFVRLIADLDAAFKLSERLARGLRAVSDMLERWRKNISALKQFVDGLGDMRSALVAAVAMMFILVTATGALNAAMLMLGRAIVFAFLPLAGVVAWFLIIEDFVSWIMGKRSLFGERFGEFKTVTEPLIAAFEEARARIAPVWEAISAVAVPILDALRAGFVAVFEAVRDNWPALLEKMTTLLDSVRAIGELVRSVLLSAFEAVTGAIGSMLTAAQGALGWIGSQLDRIRSNIEQQRGPTPFGDPGGSGLQLQNFVPQVAPGAAIGPAGAGAPVQNNDIRIEVPVTATGASGAEVAAGARSGVAQAARDMVSDLGGVARGLSMSMPLSETAAA